jgi:hypothetical protein
MAKRLTYAEKLKDPRWQRKRLEVLERDKWMCVECKSTILTLHVHHIKYTVDMPWEEPIKHLTTLCEQCHEFEEQLKENAFLKKHSQQANITCINLWRMVNVLSFTGKNHPDKLRLIKNLMNQECLDHHGAELWKHSIELLKNG